METYGRKLSQKQKPFLASIRPSRHGLAVLVILAISLQSQAQEVTFPENPLAGRFVFEQKGCSACHAIEGYGGDIGPDLGENKFYGSFIEMAGIMWNHAPEMLRRMRELDLSFPEFSEPEMVQLVAYLYYLRFLGEPGNLYRGRLLLTEKGCLACHSIAGKGGTGAPPFDQLSKYVSPLYMATALWNHGPEMERKIEKMGLELPQFGKGEIVDLSAYIREASKGTKTEQVFMSPGNPQRGRDVLKEKGCLSCHSIDGEGGDIGPDFNDLEWDYSVTEIAGLMWNHGSEMARLMKEQKLKWPRFSGQEMADLLASLYFLKFVDRSGDAIHGQQVFKDKGCVNCHGQDAKGSDQAPDLTASKRLASETYVAPVMWNHAPIMEGKIAQKIMRWPEFTSREIRDLYAYLRSLAPSN